MSISVVRVGQLPVPVGLPDIPELTLTEVHGAAGASTGLATDSEGAAHVLALESVTTALQADQQQHASFASTTFGQVNSSISTLNQDF